MAKKSNLRTIIDNSSDDLVCTEIPIQISDEKLKGTLSRSYERARKDANKFKPYKHYGIFLSTGLTLFITLFTVEFHALGKMSGAALRIVCIVACCLSLLVGFILLILHTTRKDKHILDERDEAVNEIMKNLLK